MSTVIDSLVSAINNAVKANGNKEITGNILQVVLDNMVGTLTQINGLLNVNQVNSKSTAYASASDARQAVPDNLKTEGLVIAYKLSSGWIIEQNKDISGTWTDDASWQTLGPINVLRNAETGQIDITIGSETTSVASAEEMDSIKDISSFYFFKSLKGLGQDIDYVIRISSPYDWIDAGKSYLIPKSEFNKFNNLVVKPLPNKNASIAFLTDDAVNVGQTPNFCDGTSIETISTEQAFAIPEDCNYIYVFDYYYIDNSEYPSSIGVAVVPVDKLEVGNMMPVTSNAANLAVQDANNFTKERTEIVHYKVSGDYNNKRLSPNGKLIDETYYLCDGLYYPISQGDDLSYKLRTLSNVPIICFYEEPNEDSFISAEYINGAGIIGVATAPANAKYFRYCTIPNDQYYLLSTPLSVRELADVEYIVGKSANAWKKGTLINNCIVVSDNTWYGSGHCYLIPKTSFADCYKILDIIPNSTYDAQIAFLKSDSLDVVDYCDGTSVMIIDSKSRIAIPEDCNFIYVYIYYQSVDISTNLYYYPDSIILLGVGLADDVIRLQNWQSETNKALTSINTELKFQKGGFAKDIFREICADIDLSNYPINGNIIVIGDSTIAGYITNVPVASFLTVTGTKTDISTPSDTIAGQTAKYNALSQSVKEGANYVFVQIGLNDNSYQRVDKTIFGEYQTLINTIHINSPSAKIILGVMLPCRQRYYDLFTPEQADIAYNNYLELNSAIKNLLFIGNNVCASYHYVVLSDDNGNLLPMYETTSNDHIHPNAAGAKVIAWSWLTSLYKG